MTEETKDQLHTNRRLWDALTKIHIDSEFYDVEAFRKGTCTVADLELNEIGDLTGKTLLHLQCHFGLDTMSLQRLGACATGVDFSGNAIETAREIAVEMGLSTRFIQSELFDLPNRLTEEFDLIYTSGGVLCWLPDIHGWAGIIERYLKPGGTFYIREFHPFVGIFDDREGVSAPTVHYPYFHEEPLRFDNEPSYADPSIPLEETSFEWVHTMGDIVSALSGVGLRIEFMHEFPECTYQSLPFLVKGDNGLWYSPEHKNSLPLMFSIRAVKPIQEG